MSRPDPVCGGKYVENVVRYVWNAAEKRSHIRWAGAGVAVILLRRNSLHSLDISITDFINIVHTHVNVCVYLPLSNVPRKCD